MLGASVQRCPTAVILLSLCDALWHLASDASGSVAFLTHSVCSSKHALDTLFSVKGRTITLYEGKWLSPACFQGPGPQLHGLVGTKGLQMNLLGPPLPQWPQQRRCLLPMVVRNLEVMPKDGAASALAAETALGKRHWPPSHGYWTFSPAPRSSALHSPVCGVHLPAGTGAPSLSHDSALWTGTPMQVQWNAHWISEWLVSGAAALTEAVFLLCTCSGHG